MDLPKAVFAVVKDTTAQEEHVSQLAVDSQGNAVAVGFVNGTLALPDRSTTGGVLVWSVDKHGATRWIQVFDGQTDNPADPLSQRLAVAADDSTVVAGSFRGPLVVGDQTLMGTTSHSVFVAKLDGSGAVLWAQTLSEEFWSASGVGVAPDGTIYVAGNASTELDGGTTVGAGYLLKLSPDGTELQRLFDTDPPSGGVTSMALGESSLLTLDVAEQTLEFRSYDRSTLARGVNNPIGRLFTLPQIVADTNGGAGLILGEKNAYDFGGGAHGTFSNANPVSVFLRLASDGKYINDVAFAPRAGMYTVARRPAGDYFVVGEIDGVNNDARQFPYLAHVSGAGETTYEGAYGVQGIFYAAAADASGGVYLGGRMSYAGDFGSGTVNGRFASLLLRIEPPPP